MLQHPLEVNNPKGSARLLHLSLPSSRLITGEVFDEAVLGGAMSGGSDAHGHTVCKPVLLYPAEAAGSSYAVTPVTQLAEVGPPASPGASDGQRICLVVLDGTWRQSRTMLQRNPALQRLPRLSLQPSAPSRYTVRKAHRPEQRSTLEAVCAALAQLEGTPEKFDALLSAFDGFVAQQLAYRPALGRSTRSAPLVTQVNHP
jgi:DTW domain-containing protein